jgi:hypothetical protein
MRSDEKENGSQIKNFFQWFCGINYKTENEHKLNEHLANIASIHQSKKEKLILRVSLVIVIIVAISLYTYYSLPSNSHN